MLGWLFSKIGNFRNLLYERGVFKSTPLGVPAFSIGNISVGGTGKTPMVAYVAALLAERGETVCILTRGYGRDNPRKRVLVSDGKAVIVGPREAGDEPYELAQKLLGKAAVVADGDRVSAGIWAREKFGVTAFVLDDAFQHRRVERDLDIVLIDATNPFGNGKSLRPGLLREPPENLARAGAIVITRANLAENIEELKTRISILAPGIPVFTCWNRTSRMIEFCGPGVEARGARVGEIEEVLPKKALAFGALGNPESFFEQLRREGYDIAATRAFRDHHNYIQNDIDMLEKAASDAGAEIFLSTQKDAVKFMGLYFKKPCFAMESELVFDNEEGFREMIYGFLSGGPFLSPQ